MRRILLALTMLLYTTGCAPQLALQVTGPDGFDTRGGGLADAQRPGLRVATHAGGTVLFAENGWSLGMTGISGKALVTQPDGTHFSADTTLSYVDAASASATGRSNTMGQFMLTILGVILVLGLAAIILYAAFLATAR
ncbi:MAG: hypothetical protein RBU27_01155 [Bacteroidota bacterium]|jgi:hypothetical protein|nr:hypothetical protein [Bacteroidota bacterium]